MAQPDLQALEQTIERLSPAAKRALLDYLTRALRDTPQPRTAEQQREALRRLRHELALLPVHNPMDGWSNRQHDRLLYGDA